LTLKLSLARNVKHYITQYYLPWIFIVLVAYISLWIDRSAIFARYMVLISVVIAMAALSIGSRINYIPPKISGVTPMDVYGAVCYIFVFAALIETSVLAVVENNKQQNVGHDLMPLESVG
jgi:hypothetical protein